MAMLLLTQCCNFLATQFTPGQIATWVEDDPMEVLGAKKIWQIFQAIEENMPLSLLLHRTNAEKDALGKNEEP